MERAQVLVIAAVVAALSLFALKIWSDRRASELPLGQAAERAEVRATRLRSSAEDTAAGRAQAGGGVAGSRRIGALRGAEAGSGGTPGVASAAGSADVIQGGDAARGGVVGSSAGTRGSRGGSGATISSAGDSVTADRLAARAKPRSALVEFLGSQRPTGNEILGAPSDQPDDDGGDVALEVKTTEDTAQATKAKDVDAPEDGDEGIEFTEGSQLTFPDAGNARGDAGTISVDVKPNWAGGDPTDNALVTIKSEHGFGNRLELVKNGHFLRFIVADNLNIEHDISVLINDWQPGEIRSITASWGEARTSLYINDRLVGTTTYQGQFEIAPGTPMFVGSDYRTSAYKGANATFRGFTVRTTSQHE